MDVLRFVHVVHVIPAAHVSCVSFMYCDTCMTMSCMPCMLCGCRAPPAGLLFSQVETVVSRSKLVNWVAEEQTAGASKHSNRLFHPNEVATSCILILQGTVEVVSGRDGA